MDIGGWLRGLGLERYEQAFRENEIDLRVLRAPRDVADLPAQSAGLKTGEAPITVIELNRYRSSCRR